MVKDKPLKAVIVGAGNRARLYASYAREHPEELEIVGVADPDAERCSSIRELYGFPKHRIYPSAEALAAEPRFADLVINGTMDKDHVSTSRPLLQQGYHLLLEKPIATTPQELEDLLTTARKHQRKVAICHVLRHAPFYAAVRQAVEDGEVGEIVNLQAVEHVSYHHAATAFIRGKWGRQETSKSTMLMQKSCHDADLLVWLNPGTGLKRVSSFGSRQNFRPDKAPAGAGKRCLVDCTIESECAYSARKLYIDTPERWNFYVWNIFRGEADTLSLEEKERRLREDSPFGRCVWHSDNDVVDHQSVVAEFENGSTATLNMIAGTAKASRSIHITGTKGEIQGCFEDESFVIRHFDPSPGVDFSERLIQTRTGETTSGEAGTHGGGDMRLVGDFLATVRGEPPSLSTTRLEDSITGHLLVFAADQSRVEGRTVEVGDFASSLYDRNQPAYGTANRGPWP